MGFNSIQEMMSCISKKEFEKYASEHANCCGFYKGEYTIMRRCDKGMGITKKRKEKHNKIKEDSSPINIRRGFRGRRFMRFRRPYRGIGRWRTRGNIK